MASTTNLTLKQENESLKESLEQMKQEIEKLKQENEKLNQFDSWYIRKKGKNQDFHDWIYNNWGDKGSLLDDMADRSLNIYIDWNPDEDSEEESDEDSEEEIVKLSFSSQRKPNLWELAEEES